MKKSFISFIAILLVVCSGFAQTANKKLYLSDGQTLDRIDPVATSDATTAQTIDLFKNAATFVASSTFKTANGGTANTISGAFTVATGTNRLLVVGIGSVPVAPVTSVTFNGVALTKLGQIANGTATKAEIWYLLAPPEVTANVVVNWTGTVEAAVGVANYVNVDQNNPFGTLVTNVVNSVGNFSLAVPSNIGDIAFDVVSSTSNTALTVAAQTPVQNSIFGAGTNSVKVASSWRTGQAGTTNMAWTGSNSANWSGLGVALKGFSNNDAVFTFSPAL
jgi:hypothetical protein